MAITTGHEPRFSPPARLLLWLVLPSLLAVLYLASPHTAGFSILVLLAPTAFFRHVAKDRSANLAPVDIMRNGNTRPDSSSSSPGSSPSPAWLSLLRDPSYMAWTWQYFTFLAILTYILAGLLEELMKYLAVTTARRRSAKLTDLAYIYLVIAATLGFSAIEKVGFVYAAGVHKSFSWSLPPSSSGSQ